MFRFSDDNFVCFDKANFQKYIQDKDKINIRVNDIDYVLLQKVLDYVKTNQKISVWTLDENNEITQQADLFYKQNFLGRKVDESRDKICSRIRDGRDIQKYQGFVVKSDPTDLDNEIKIYKDIVNPSVQNLLSSNYILALKEGSCPNGQKWLALEAVGEMNLYEYFMKTNLSRQEYLALVLQCLYAYQYLLNQGYVHGDFKPQNLLVEDTKISFVDDIPTYGKLVKLIDFGWTQAARKKIFIDDMRKYFRIMRDVKQNRDLLLVINSYLDENVYTDDDNASKILTKFISYMKTFATSSN